MNLEGTPLVPAMPSAELRLPPLGLNACQFDRRLSPTNPSFPPIPPSPKTPVTQRFQVYFSPLFAPFQALCSATHFQPQKRLLVSNRKRHHANS
jgi:hypothetical protein